MTFVSPEMPRDYSGMAEAKKIEVEESSEVVLKCEVEFEPEFFSVGWARADKRDNLR